MEYWELKERNKYAFVDICEWGTGMTYADAGSGIIKRALASRTRLIPWE